MNDTIENVLQGDAYKNIDFLTGVTLNEGLYFAEYHIRHLHSGLQNQSVSMGKAPSREKRSISYPNSTAIIAPDITFTTDDDDEKQKQENVKNEEEYENNEKQRISKIEPTINIEQSSSSDSNLSFLERFIQSNYTERYTSANFQYGQCFIDEVKKRYELSGI